MNPRHTAPPLRPTLELYTLEELSRSCEDCGQKLVSLFQHPRGCDPVDCVTKTTGKDRRTIWQGGATEKAALERSRNCNGRRRPTIKDEPGRSSAAHLLTRELAQPPTSPKLPEMLRLRGPEMMPRGEAPTDLA
jgi:hypothetical protein